METKIEMYPDVCCDECMETIHNHMACPACGDSYAETDLYGPLYEEDVGFVLSCEVCGAGFELMSKPSSTDDDYTWKPRGSTGGQP